jgi:hypothetical protein
MFNTIAPDRRNDSEFGKMGVDCIDHRRLLTDEQTARAMEHQAALLLARIQDPVENYAGSTADRTRIRRESECGRGSREHAD